MRDDRFLFQRHSHCMLKVISGWRGGADTQRHSRSIYSLNFMKKGGEVRDILILSKE